MAINNFNGFKINLTQAEYDELKFSGKLIKDGETILFDENTIYHIYDAGSGVDNFVTLGTEQTISGRKIFSTEVALSGILEATNDIKVTDHPVKLLDTTNDYVTQLSAKNIVIENGESNTYTLTLPLKTGTLVTTADVDLGYSTISSTSEEGGTHSDSWSTTDTDTTLSMYHEDGTTLAEISVSKEYAHMSAIDSTSGSAEVTVTQSTISIVSQGSNNGDQIVNKLSVATDGVKVNEKLITQTYIELSGEDGTLTDEEYTLVTDYDSLLIKRSGVLFRKVGYPANGSGSYSFISPFYAKPNGTEEFDAYIITINTDKTWTFTLKNFAVSVASLLTAPSVTISPENATGGTFGEDDFNNLTENDDVVIIRNGEYYRLADDGFVEGIRSYVHTGWNGTAVQDKSINITLSTKSWVLSTGRKDTYEHIIKVSGNNDDTSEAYEFMFSFVSNKSTTVTTQSGLIDLIGSETQLPVSGWRKTDGVYYPVIYVKGGNTYYYLNQTTGPSQGGITSLGSYNIVDEVK